MEVCLEREYSLAPNYYSFTLLLCKTEEFFRLLQKRYAGRKIRDCSPIFLEKGVVMILPQVHLRKPCYDFTFL